MCQKLISSTELTLFSIVLDSNTCSNVSHVTVTFKWDMLLHVTLHVTAHVTVFCKDFLLKVKHVTTLLLYFKKNFVYYF